MKKLEYKLCPECQEIIDDAQQFCSQCCQDLFELKEKYQSVLAKKWKLEGDLRLVIAIAKRKLKFLGQIIEILETTLEKTKGE